jgi:pimeloyl-ACP methyl ester carboxylesterase
MMSWSANGLMQLSETGVVGGHMVLPVIREGHQIVLEVIRKELDGGDAPWGATRTKVIYEAKVVELGDEEQKRNRYQPGQIIRGYEPSRRLGRPNEVYYQGWSWNPGSKKWDSLQNITVTVNDGQVALISGYRRDNVWLKMDPETKQAGPIVAMDVLDGNPVLHGETSDRIRPSVLIQSSIFRRGTTADGTSRLIVRAELSSVVPVVFHVSKGRGTIKPMFEGRTLTLQDRHYAFGLYEPPNHFAPPGGDGPTVTVQPPKQRLGGSTIGPECEDLQITAIPGVATPEGRITPSPQESRQVEIKLVRPPVVLVHGLFSNPVQCWMGRLGEGQSLSVLLEQTGFVPFHVNYARSNGSYGEQESFLTGKPRASDFDSNSMWVWESPDNDFSVEYEAGWLKGEDSGWLAQVPPTSELPQWQRPRNLQFGGIRAALEYYRNSLGIAATQVDVIGHSMGGILARVYASDDRSANTNHPYRRLENFFQGDIHRLITLNTPHFGSELAEMTDIFGRARIGEEAFPAWARRQLLATLLRGLFANPDAEAIRDLRPESEALKRIGHTRIPAFSIATTVNHGQMAENRQDPEQLYLKAYSGIGMLFFHNSHLLEEAIDRRALQWSTAGELRKNSSFPRPSGPALPSLTADFASQSGIGEFKSRLIEGFNENVFYWSQYREAEYRESLGLQVGNTTMVKFGVYEHEYQYDEDSNTKIYPTLTDQIAGMLSEHLLGGNVLKASIDPPVPEGIIDALICLIFNGDTSNDAAVRELSQLGGLPKDSTKTFAGMTHSFAPLESAVQREVLRLLRWEDRRFCQDGFPPAGQPMPRWLPTAAFATARTEGPEAIDWAGMVRSHASEFSRISDQRHLVILARPVNQDSTPLIAAHAATKGMAIKGKSANWGPQRGFIPVDQKFSKIWRTKKDKARDDDIKKYNAVNQEVLFTLKYPEDDLRKPHLKGRRFAVAVPLAVKIGQKTFDVLIDAAQTDAEKAIFLHADGRLYDWKTSRDGREFDPCEEPKGELSREEAERILQEKVPLEVLADGLSDRQEPKPKLTADYDLLAIGFYSPDFHGVPDDVKNAKLDKLRGFITERQMEVIEDINQSIANNTGYEGGDVVHHGPEVQYPGSPYVDYPILVFDPGDHGIGDAQIFIIRQGPPGFRDIHLKRYFTEKIRQGFNLWPNPVSEGWKWEWSVHRRFSKARGYDPRDAPTLKDYVAEQIKAQNRDCSDVGDKSPDQEPADPSFSSSIHDRILGSWLKIGKPVGSPGGPGREELENFQPEKGNSFELHIEKFGDYYLAKYSQVTKQQAADFLGFGDRIEVGQKFGRFQPAGLTREGMPAFSFFRWLPADSAYSEEGIPLFLGSDGTFTTDRLSGEVWRSK